MVDDWVDVITAPHPPARRGPSSGKPADDPASDDSAHRPGGHGRYRERAAPWTDVDVSSCGQRRWLQLIHRHPDDESLDVDEVGQHMGCPTITVASMRREAELRALYAAFNSRDIDAVLSVMAPNVDWPNGWGGGRVVGRDEVRDYWLRQWVAIDPTVEPTRISERSDGSIEVRVHQVVRDLAGAVRSDLEVRHVYSFLGDRVDRMDIEE